MKLRVRDNSIRLRLTQGEVEQVRASGLVRGRTRLPGSHSFDYVLESSPATVKPEAHMSSNVLTVRVPQLDIAGWADSDKISIAARQDLGDGEELTILVEKDFVCLTGRDDEDESDMYPHPQAESGSC